jgi:hypothetical protein
MGGILGLRVEREKEKKKEESSAWLGRRKIKGGRIKKKRKRDREAAGACSQCPPVTCVQLACHQWGYVCHVTSF